MYPCREREERMMKSFKTTSGTDQMGTDFMILYCGISYLKMLIRTSILNSFCESNPFMWLVTVQRQTQQVKKSLAQQIYSSCLVIPCIFLHKWWGQHHPALCSMKLTERAVPAHNWLYWAGGFLLLLLANQIVSHGISHGNAFLAQIHPTEQSNMKKLWEFLFKDFRNFDFK